MGWLVGSDWAHRHEWAVGDLDMCMLGRYTQWYQNRVGAERWMGRYLEHTHFTQRKPEAQRYYVTWPESQPISGGGQGWMLGLTLEAKLSTAKMMP